MKYLFTCAVGVLLGLCSMHASAQDIRTVINTPLEQAPKSKLFTDLPDNMRLQLSSLTALLDEPVGTSVQLSLTPSFRCTGAVVSRSDASDQRVKSIVVRLSDRPGATLTFTRIRQDDGSFHYIGRILSFKHGDAYDIVRQGNDYRLQKKEAEDLLSE
ncbi:MAG TPA: hypothetical protein VHK69_00235 [Chitinophagaceae bacterium]|jgi:hypothetical protein|nr:hypothetical protein [Chitinophagaceae bacterium]